MSYVVSYTYSLNKFSNYDTPDAALKPERAGYYFAGWTTTEGATEVVYKADQLLEVAEGTVLYAVWIEGEEPAPAPEGGEGESTENGENTENTEQNG